MWVWVCVCLCGVSRIQFNAKNQTPASIFHFSSFDSEQNRFPVLHFTVNHIQKELILCFDPRNKNCKHKIDFRNEVNNIIEMKIEKRQIIMIYKPLKTVAKEIYLAKSKLCSFLFFSYQPHFQLFVVDDRALKKKTKKTNNTLTFLLRALDVFSLSVSVLCQTFGFHLKCVDFSLLQLFKCYISQHDRKCGKKYG